MALATGGGATARAMGHLPISGPGGSFGAAPAILRCTPPVHAPEQHKRVAHPGSPERSVLDHAGVEVAMDGQLWNCDRFQTQPSGRNPPDQPPPARPATGCPAPKLRARFRRPVAVGLAGLVVTDVRVQRRAVVLDLLAATRSLTRVRVPG